MLGRPVDAVGEVEAQAPALTATWITIAILCAGTIAIKSVGPIALGEHPPSERVSSVIRLIAPALLAALIVYEALGADGRGWSASAWRLWG